MKALNNLVSAAGFLISVEALLIGKRFGLDPAVMVDVLNASTGMNNSTQKKLKQFVLSRTLRLGLRPRPDGQGPVDRAAGRAGDGDGDAVRRAVPRDGERGGEPGWGRGRTHGAGQAVGAAGGQRTRARPSDVSASGAGDTGGCGGIVDGAFVGPVCVTCVCTVCVL